LRRDQTDAERKLWAHLRSRQVGGAKFRPQHFIHPFIVDFCCPEHWLVMELDGGQHAMQAEADQRRTAFLAAQGYRVLRFWNHEVLTDIEAVMERIVTVLSSQRPSPQPSPSQGEGEESDMKTATNLFPQVTTFTNLCRAFRDAGRGKQDKPEVQVFAYHLEDRLWEIKHELEAEKYVWGGYRPFWISDPKPRLIKAAPFRDRIVHHALYNVLEPLWERSYIRDTYACLRGRGTLAAVRRYEEFVRWLGGKGYVIYPGGYKRMRRRNVVNARRRVKALEVGYAQGEVTFAHARSSIASWLGLATPAKTFRLSRHLFLEHDVRNIGKRLLVRMICRDSGREAMPCLISSPACM